MNHVTLVIGMMVLPYKDYGKNLRVGVYPYQGTLRPCVEGLFTRPHWE